jgi:hypothetical protein
MKKKLITIGLAMLGCLGLAHAQTLITNVTANPLWTDTGIALTNSEWVSVNGGGFWSWPTANDPDGDLVGSSDDTWLDIDPNHGNLIAFIGANPYQGSQWGPSGVFQTNQYLAVGTARQFMSTTNGELWLGINDDAFIGSTSDNSGSNYVAITLGFCKEYNFTNPILSVASVSSNLFSFYISNGIPNSICAVFDSADLRNWTLVDSLQLDANGSSVSAMDLAPPSSTSGLIGGAFVNITDVPYRFYKICDGPIWSQPVGFERITVGPGIQATFGTNVTTAIGTNAFIADQLLASANTLNTVLNPMVDGTTLPNGTQLLKAHPTGFDAYTYSSGSWSPNGNATLLPGEGGVVILPTNSPPVTITFAGLVPEGVLTNYPITNFLNNIVISSMIPQAGGVQSQLGYTPGSGDNVMLWSGFNISGSGFRDYLYQGAGVGTSLGFQSDWTDGNSVPPSPPSIPGDQLDSVDDVYWAPEPVIKVGQAFEIQNEQTYIEYWVRKFPGCCDP